jgi:hypothetical protein
MAVEFGLKTVLREKEQPLGSACRCELLSSNLDSSEISATSHRTRVKVVVPLLPPTFYVICSQILQLIIEEKNEENTSSRKRERYVPT